MKMKPSIALFAASALLAGVAGASATWFHSYPDL